MPTDLFETRFVDCWIVGALTGEWSDRNEWPVAVFLSEDRAKELVTRMDNIAEKHCLNSRAVHDYDKNDERMKAFNDELGFVALTSVGYTGVSFYVTKAIFGG